MGWVCSCGFENPDGRETCMSCSLPRPPGFSESMDEEEKYQPKDSMTGEGRF